MTSTSCSCRKLTDAGWLVRCAACGADTLTNTAALAVEIDAALPTSWLLDNRSEWEASA